MTINIKQYFFIFGNQEGLSPKTKGNCKDTKHGKQIPEQSARNTKSK
jgi:hypothetical protein